MTKIAAILTALFLSIACVGLAGCGGGRMDNCEIWHNGGGPCGGSGGD